MELNLTEEQVLMRDSATRFIEAAGPKVARGFRGSDPGFQPARLREAADLGWLGILVPEAAGGLGLGLTELALMLEQSGRGLVCEPVGFAAIAAFALSAGPKPHPMLESVLMGKALVVPALHESAFGDPLVPNTQAKGQDAAWRLTGAKAFVCADGADGFLVSADASGRTALFHVARDASGVALTATETVDGRRLWTLRLVDTPAEIVPPHPSSRSAVEALHDLALFSLSAELLGVMEKAQEITLDYLRTRKQFGRAIGSFQAIQHQSANIFVRIEATRSLVFQIAVNNDAASLDPAMAIAAKAKASEDAIAVTQNCIQLHGGIGFTDEHDIGLYLKRAMLLSSQFGNATAQRQRYVAIVGLSA